MMAHALGHHHSRHRSLDGSGGARRGGGSARLPFLVRPEHTHIPTSTPHTRRRPRRGAGRGDKRTLDPYIRSGRGGVRAPGDIASARIALVAQHDPIALAKQIATLDLLSEGRLVLGIGYGWNQEEMESHGIDTKRRRAHVREVMLAMQALWSQEVAEFRGEFVRFEPSWQWPKPVQQPRPPVLIGGAPGPKLFAHIAEYADGWIPTSAAGCARRWSSCARRPSRGRDFASLRIVPMGVMPSAEKLAYYRELGLHEAVLRVRRRRATP